MDDLPTRDHPTPEPRTTLPISPTVSVRIGPLAVEQRAAEFFLQQLDCPCERGLGDMAAFSSASEVQVIRDGQEVTDLMHLHAGLQR